MISHSQLSNNLKDRERPQRKKTMKDLASCFSNQAVRVAPNSSRLMNTNCTQTSLYHSRLISSQKEILIRLTWSKNHDGVTLAVHVDDLSCSDSPTKNGSISLQLSQKNKGNRIFTSGSYTVDLCWDVSQAKYEKGFPEPVSGFHVGMHVDSEFVLLIGDMTEGLLNNSDEAVAETRLVSRIEQVHGSTCYTTKARFHPTEKEHKININCEEEKQKLSVSVDDKCVVQVENLTWNFRGNDTIYIDHLLPVDIMWDLHGWFCRDKGSFAKFMFLSRSTPKKWIWQLEEEDTMQNCFSVSIQMSKGRH